MRLNMKKLYGIVPPMTTPFDEEEELDYDLLRKDVKYLVEKAGVHGVAIGGSTGEGYALTTKELREALEVATKEVKGKIPVIAGIIVDSTRQAIERAKAIQDLDIDALQITPVHYLFKPTDEMMYEYFSKIAGAVDIPILIYNVVPWSYCSPELLIKIITEVDGVIGVKQSAADMKLLADLIHGLKDRGTIFSAVDALMYPSLALGAHGGIAAILTAVPELCVKLWDQVRAGDHKGALETHNRLLTIWNTLSAVNLPANVKYAMELQGRPSGRPRSPMPSSSEEQKKMIKAALKQTGLIS
jgi:4-hydroxy-tetrahydrodipicolinate synthase